MSYYRWAAVLCIYPGSVSGLTQGRSDGGWTLLPDSEVGRQLCPFSLCRVARRRAAQLNAAGLGRFWPNSCRHAETQLSPWTRRFFTARHQQREGGRKTREQTKGLTHSLRAPHLTLRIVRWFIFSPPQFTAYHFLRQYTGTLKERRSPDPPGSLRGGPRLINWQPFDIVQSVWPPALWAGLPLCVLAPLLSPQLFTLVIYNLTTANCENGETEVGVPPG